MHVIQKYALQDVRRKNSITCMRNNTNMWNASYLCMQNISHYFRLFWGFDWSFHCRCSLSLTTLYPNIRELFKCWVSLIKCTIQTQHFEITDISKLHGSSKSYWRAYLSSVSDKWYFVSSWLSDPVEIIIIHLGFYVKKWTPLP